MDFTSIDKAIEAYRPLLNEKDLQRLLFFRDLWTIQGRISETLAKTTEYPLPNLKEAEEWYWQERPFLQMAPVSIDKEAFIAALEEISAFLAQEAGFKHEVSESLKVFNWRNLVEACDLTLAGSDPLAYSQTFCAKAEELSASALLPQTSFIVFGYAIRPFLEQVSSALMDGLSDAIQASSFSHDKPLHCPTCGCDATVALVGEYLSGKGNTRALYCGLCGTAWEFERIRCARCGTRSQQNLHYFHLEGDDAHRLHNCRECGDYIRTVFQESLGRELSFEVEDVVMSRLDTVANDPRFAVNTCATEL